MFKHQLLSRHLVVQLHLASLTAKKQKLPQKLPTSLLYSMLETVHEKSSMSKFTVPIKLPKST